MAPWTVLTHVDQKHHSLGEFSGTESPWWPAWGPASERGVTCSHTRGTCRASLPCAHACVASGGTESWRRSYTRHIWKAFPLQQIEKCCTWIIIKIGNEGLFRYWNFKNKFDGRHASGTFKCLFSERRRHWFLFPAWNRSTVHVLQFQRNLHKQDSTSQLWVGPVLEVIDKLRHIRAIIKISMRLKPWKSM